MQQLEFFSIPSPCVGICTANNRGYCVGCYRSREERQQWLQLNAEQQRHVVRLCQQRKERVAAARRAQQKTSASESEQQQLF